jgi:hypothetical protein
VDFRNTVIIMTSNAGTRQLKDFGRGVGFSAGSTSALALNEQDKQHARDIVQKALSKQFSPEFLNRLDEIITFDQLDLDAIKRIIDVELKGLYQRIEQIGYKINLSEEAKEFVATKGYDDEPCPHVRVLELVRKDGSKVLTFTNSGWSPSIVEATVPDAVAPLPFLCGDVEVEVSGASAKFSLRPWQSIMLEAR